MLAELHAISTLPYSRVLVGTGEPIEQEGLLEFRLLYEGPLLSAGNRSAVENKHHVRRALHPQLRKLWWEHLGLRQLAAHRGNQADPRIGADERQRFDAGIAAISRDWPKCDFAFVPLVTQESSARCSLEILLLRPEGEQSVVGLNGPTMQRFVLNQGDIDGQLKTLFDALRFPNQPTEIRGIVPDADESPLFCLLSDDKLISEVRVTADQLLLLPNHKQAEAHDSFVLIHVKVNPKYPGAMGNYLG